MRAQFVSEPIRPRFDAVQDTADGPCSEVVAEHAGAIGEPIVPSRFVWRDGEYTVLKLLGAWKELSPRESGSGERYVRRHWYHIRTSDGLEMKIYFERQARSQGAAKRRWWLFSIG